MSRETIPAPPADFQFHTTARDIERNTGRLPTWVRFEILTNGSWLLVDEFIWRSYTGERRLNGEQYQGPIYVLGTAELSRSF
jgi:hypothetical protein